MITYMKRDKHSKLNENLFVMNHIPETLKKDGKGNNK